MNLQNSILDGFKTMKDGSLKITIITRELSPNQMAELMINLNKEIVQIEIPDELSGSKSPSKRLKDRMFIYYNKKYKDKKGFNNWYIGTLDEIGEKYLEKIKE